MKNIYLIDEHVSSKTNGIGPFLRSYISCLKKINVNICVVSFNADVREFDIRMDKGVKKLLFPFFPNGNFPENSVIINRFFRLHIPDSVDNVFCFNHSPCKELLRTVRDSFPLSKIIFTIHDMGWTSMLNGDLVKFRNIISNRKKKSVSSRYQYLLDYSDEEKQMYEIADAVVCLTENTREVLREVYEINEDKINLIPSGLKKTRTAVSDHEKARIRESMYIGTNEKIILYVGRLSGPKGIYALVSCFSDILKTYPDTRLILAGSANDGWSRFFSAARYVASKITVTGFISRQELNRLYAIADIGIIPSYYEQCPYAGMEMMMHGLPIVASDANGLRDMFTDGVNARVAEIGNSRNEDEFSHNLRNAVAELLAAEELCNTLGKQALRSFYARYEAIRMCERYQHFFEKLS